MQTCRKDLAADKRGSRKYENSPLIRVICVYPRPNLTQNNSPLLFNAKISIENATVQCSISPSQIVPLRYEIQPRKTPATIAANASAGGFCQWIIVYGTVIARML